ncbi:hypothetical protein XA68_11669 [Ophiocordyceps unilateralis]|uniref:ATP-dependent RNA helicase n=1 Tax=Ophiocordyceps unilateralis TaxID=268505 RepID=A0A2A9PGG0_OPHUN|nr:hypothetical protein XA68_11669 [Ophiocordyceps unilateralis]
MLRLRLLATSTSPLRLVKESSILLSCRGCCRLVARPQPRRLQVGLPRTARAGLTTATTTTSTATDPATDAPDASKARNNVASAVTDAAAEETPTTTTTTAADAAADAAPANNTADSSLVATDGTASPTPSPTEVTQLQDKIHPDLYSALLNLEYERMTTVQAASIESLLTTSRPDGIIQAPIGAGKTLAYLIPALHHMMTAPDAVDARRVAVLILAPTRELAFQIKEDAKTLLMNSGHGICTAIGGTNIPTEIRLMLRGRGSRVLVATPGRLMEHLQTEAAWQLMRELETLIVDEADHPYVLSYFEKILKMLPDKATQPRQTMVVRADPTPDSEKIVKLFTGSNPVCINTTRSGELLVPNCVKQRLVTVPDFASLLPALVGSLRREAAAVGRDFKAIIYVPTTGLAGYYTHVINNLCRDQLPAAAYTERRSRHNLRKAVLEEFRSARSGILVATDNVSRGINITGITSVFQVGLPFQSSSYFHRLGNAAREGAGGNGIFILAEPELWFVKQHLQSVTLDREEADVEEAQQQLKPITDELASVVRNRLFVHFLSFYGRYLEEFNWTKKQLVDQANIFAKDALGAPHQLSLRPDLVQSMGLRGLPNLLVSNYYPMAAAEATGELNIRPIQDRAGMAWKKEGSWGKTKELSSKRPLPMTSIPGS